MLPPDSRHILLELMRPPPGYELDRAVGTTFTLDLEAALVLPLAFASFRLATTKDPIAVMQAVRSASEKVDVFCQAGQMKVPSEANGLFNFLEKMVHQVRRPRPGRLFHPKVWYLRYVAEGERAAVRLLVLSRNLTNDASWDLGLRLDGAEVGGNKTSNRPLADLLRALPGMAVHSPGRTRTAAVHRLADSARRVVWQLPDHVKEQPRFWVFGLTGSQPRPDFSGYRTLVMAPFLNDRGLNVVAPRPRRNVTVVSRIEDLDRLAKESLSELAEVRVVSAAADLADDDDDASHAPSGEGDYLVGLHAKLFVVERNRAAYVFVGSANATDAAFAGNVEILVELTGGASRLGVEQMLSAETGFGGILEDYLPVGDLPVDPAEEAAWALRQALQAIAERPWTATVLRDGERFSEQIESTLPGLPSGVTGKVSLLAMPGTALAIVDGVRVDGTLGPVSLDEVTPFVVVTLSCSVPGAPQLHRSCVVRCRLVNDPDGRLDEILARQVDTPEKFLRFLLLLLGLTDVQLGLGAGGAGDRSGGAWRFNGRSNGVFELLARAVAEQPGALDTLESLVPRLRQSDKGLQALPPGFDELWKVIEAARPSIAAMHKADAS